MRNYNYKIIILFIAAIFVSFLLLTSLNRIHLVYERRQSDTPFGEIEANYSLMTQLPVTRETRISQVSIMMATYARYNTCSVNFYIYKNGKEMYHHTIKSANTIQDNAYYDLKHISLDCGPEDEVYLVITSPDAVPGNAITAWMLKDGDGPQAYIYNLESGEKAEFGGSLMFSIYEERPLLEVLYRSYSSTGWIAIPVSGILLGLFALVVKELVPLEELRRKRYEAHHPDTLL